MFYRCFQGVKYEFLCAKSQGGDRLWWSQHGTPQVLPQSTAQCAFPCDTKRQCTSPGGVLRDDGPVSESIADANRIFNSCPAPVTPGPNPNQNDNSLDDLFKLPDQYDVCTGVADATFVSSPKYCNIFHVCISGKRKDFVCAKASNTYDLWWNQATKQCDWPCKVQCNKQVFGSQQSASDIQKLDFNQNSAVCSSSGNVNPNANPTQYPTSNPTGTTPGPSSPQPTQPFTVPTIPPTNNNNNYNNNGNFFTIPQGMYGKK